MARGQAIGAMVFNRPQLIALDQLQPIINYLSAPDRATTLQLNKSEDETPKLTLSDFSRRESYERYRLSDMGINPDTMVGTLDISGSLMYRKGSMGADCRELTSYEGLKQQTQAMINEGVESIVMMVDSGGGMAYGMFAAADYIKKITKEAGVKTIAYVDGVSYSAAYGLSVLADEVVVNPQASVGSVGVVVALYNNSKMLENAGVTRQFVFAGENKIPFDNKTGEFTDTFIEDLQKSVNKTYSSFVKHISLNRELSEQDVINTQASVYDAEEALALGLVDKIMSLEEFEVEYGLKGAVVNTPSARGMVTNSQTIKEVTMSKDTINEVVVEGELLSNAHINPNGTGTNMSEDLKVQMSELQTKYEDLSANLADVTEKLVVSEILVKELQGEIAEKELSQRTGIRKAMLEAALGKDNESVATLLTSTEILSDEAFETVTRSFATAQDTVQQGLNEVGGEGQEALKQLGLAEQMKQKAQTMYNRKA